LLQVSEAIGLVLTILVNKTTSIKTTKTTYWKNKDFLYRAKCGNKIFNCETKVGDRSLSHKSEVCIPSFEQQQQTTKTKTTSVHASNVLHFVLSLGR
jgi:hypothetical protein